MGPIKTVEKIITLTAILAGLVACDRYQDISRAAGLSESITLGEPYRHRIFTNPAAQEKTASERWHVYVEGDGRAVNSRGAPSLDPTPRTPLLLSMMAQDPRPGLYLGRPCYFHTDDPLCSPVNWTLARYSEETVSSMALALHKHVTDDAPITLIGHSGGGTLAVLLAARLKNVDQVVTLAGNLQVTKWTTFHHYSPLSLSLDPARQPPLSPCTRQYHLAGAQDQEILPDWIEEYSQTQPSSHFQQLNDADHRTGWPLWWTLINIEPTIKTQRCDKVTR